VDACFRPEALALSEMSSHFNLVQKNPAISSYMQLITKQIGVSV